jgi:hypothetical protein
VACLLLYAALLAAQAPNAAVSGVVLNDTTGAPIPRALVVLSTTGADPADATTYTDGNGAFGFSQIPPGSYQLHADCGNCMAASYGAATPNDPPATLQLQAGEWRRGLEMRLQPLGAISGVVLDPDGDPLPGANVKLFVHSYARRKPTLQQVRTVQTNERGEYRIFHVPKGVYLLLAEQFMRMHFAHEPAGSESKYGRQFYSNADRQSAATPVKLAPGKELSGIDFHLPLRQTVRLKGEIAAPPGFPSNAPIILQLTSQDLTVGNAESVSASTPFADHTFEIDGLVPGTYLVSARASFEGKEYIGAQRVELSRDSEQITIRLDPGIELAGKIALEGEPPDPAPRFHVQLIPGDAIASAAGTRQAEVKPDGSFRIPNVTPGIWDIGVQPIPAGGYLKAIHLGAQDVLTEDMPIGPDTTAPLNIVVSTRGAVVEGTVLEPVGGEKPVRAAVVLAPEGKFAEVESFFRVAMADDSGHFEMEGLTPGTYRLYAFDRMDPEFVGKPEALKPYRDQGNSVKLAEGARVSKQLRRIAAAPRTTREGKR